MEPRDVLRAFRAALEAAGLPRHPFHHLRHAQVALHQEVGDELMNISRTLGHADLIAAADLYAHLTSTTQRRMAERIDGTLAG